MSGPNPVLDAIMTSAFTPRAVRLQPVDAEQHAAWQGQLSELCDFQDQGCHFWGTEPESGKPWSIMLLDDPSKPVKRTLDELWRELQAAVGLIREERSDNALTAAQLALDNLRIGIQESR